MGKKKTGSLLFGMLVGGVMFGATAHAQLEGSLDLYNCKYGAVIGWAEESATPNTPISVDIYVNGNSTPLQRVVASNPYQDLNGTNRGNHGFSVAGLRGYRQVDVKYGGTTKSLPNSPRTCP